MIYVLDRRRCRTLVLPTALSQLRTSRSPLPDSAFGAPFTIAHMSNVETLARPRRFQTDCTFTGNCVENTAVIGCRHRNFAICQQLWWLRARFPPNNIMSLMVSSFANARSTPSSVAQNIVDVFRRPRRQQPKPFPSFAFGDLRRPRLPGKAFTC